MIMLRLMLNIVFDMFFEIVVVVVIICDCDNCFCFSCCFEYKYQGGLWEFFGGKVEEGEFLEWVLVCEFDEELGMKVVCFQFFMIVCYCYLDLCVMLYFCEVIVYIGEFYGCEGQLVEWVLLQDFFSCQFFVVNQLVVIVFKLFW